MCELKKMERYLRVNLLGPGLRLIYIYINCNWVVTRWQWLFYMYTKHEIGY